MKKSLKIITTIAILSLVITVFSACSITFGNNTPQTTESETTTETTTEVETTIPTTENTETTVNETEIVSIDTLLNSIKNFPMGTAGSTAKGVNIALDLINYAEFTTDSEKDIKAAYNALRADMNDDDKSIFDENLLEIKSFADELLKGGKIKEYINSPDDYNEGEYSKDKYESVVDLIS